MQLFFNTTVEVVQILQKVMNEGVYRADSEAREHLLANACSMPRDLMLIKLKGITDIVQLSDIIINRHMNLHC